MVTVREILQLPAFKNATVVAGTEGLERKVSSITVSEVPDAERFYRGGEIILTAFYPFREDPGAIPAAIERYARKGAAAVAFKLGYYLPELNSAIKEIAERTALPLIEVPDPIRWPEIINDVVQELAEKENVLQRSLAKEFLEERDLNRGLAVLRHWLMADVILFSKNLHVRAGTKRDATEELNRQANLVGQWLSGSSIVKKSVSDGRAREVLPPLSVGGGAPILLCAVSSGQEHLGYLVEMGNQSPFTVADKEALQHAATLVGVELMHQHMAQTADFKSRERLLEYLLDTHQEERVAKVNRGGHPIGMVMVMRPVSGSSVPDLKMSELKAELLSVTQAVLGELNRQVLIGTTENVITIFLPMEGSQAGKARGSVARELLGALKDAAEELLEECVNIGNGSWCYSLMDVQQSYQEALRALEMGVALEYARSETDTVDGQLLSLLSQIDPVSLSGFCNRKLAPLLEHDMSRNTDLLKTLRVFFDNDKNMTRTAAKVYLHRNTLNHRLEQINKLTGLDFTDMKACLSWQIALKVQTLLEHGKVQSLGKMVRDA